MSIVARYPYLPTSINFSTRSRRRRELAINLVITLGFSLIVRLIVG